MKRIGSGDITYCMTPCEQKRCKRNSKYWEAPTMYCSMSYFDKDNEDIMHATCDSQWLVEEEKKRGRPKKITNGKS